MSSPVHVGTATDYKVAATTHTMLVPAYSTGDRVLVAVALDSGINVGSITSVVAPDGETVSLVQARFGDGGTGQTSLALYSYVATDNQSAGAALVVNLGTSDQCATAVMAFSGAGSIANLTTGFGNAATASAPATTATNALGIVVQFVGSDNVHPTAVPDGYTSRSQKTGGAVNIIAATRIAATTAAESIAAAGYPLSGTEDYAALTCVIEAA